MGPVVKAKNAIYVRQDTTAIQPSSHPNMRPKPRKIRATPMTNIPIIINGLLPYLYNNKKAPIGVQIKLTEPIKNDTILASLSILFRKIVYE